MYRLVRKQTTLKKHLRSLNKDIFEEMHAKYTQLSRICLIQNAMQAETFNKNLYAQEKGAAIAQGGKRVPQGKI